ncbi:transmembrane protein 252 [Bufo gargarizans]|uniref:transmembrane protein 252 n=1 Tax=Bufo gargarizans TaxID=30331 RepID=UPI001CF1DEC3|nr:transmembrane protein 252 [Bufo gargarizans]
MKNSVYTVLRFSLLIIGFCLVCLGAFYVSSSYSCNCRSETIVAYTLMPLGFVLLLIGIFWSTYHEANHKSLFRSVIRRIHSQQQVHIETVDRPDYYPPSYDSAMQHTPSNATYINMETEGFNIPPPLYTETAMEVVDETYMNEDPPPYEASVQEYTSQSFPNCEVSEEAAND